MNLILIPGRKGINEGVYESAKKASAGTDTLIRVSLDRTVVKKASRIIILTEAKYKGRLLGAYEIYKKVFIWNKTARIIVFDGWKWPVKEQYMLPRKNLVKDLLAAIKGHAK